MEQSSGESIFSKKPFTIIAIIVFSIVSCGHLFRLFFTWEITFNGAIIPVWVSGFGFLIAAGLAWMLWKETFK
jgi:hypothetical protein